MRLDKYGLCHAIAYRFAAGLNCLYAGPAGAGVIGEAGTQDRLESEVRYIAKPTIDDAVFYWRRAA
jgi:hypothetical protein